MTKSKTYSKFHFGIQDGKRLQNGFFDLQNVDIHSDIGAGKGQLKLELESGAVIDEECFSAVAPNGDTYFFSTESGRIFKRTQIGVFTEIRTNANGIHKGCNYYDGYIYYATDDKLGRFDLASTWDDSWDSLITGKNHAMMQFDLILYICNGRNIASVDDTGVFTTSALDLPLQYETVSLMQYGDDLLALGNADYINDSKVFRWNTYSSSWTISDKIKKQVISFIDADNYVFVVTVSGEVYRYNGSQLSPVFKLPEFSTHNSYIACSHQGKALVANGTRIYSIHRKNVNSPFVLNGEYTATGTVESIVASGSDLLVSHSGGIDNIGTDRADAVLTTPLAIGKFVDIKVSYYDLPTGTSIEIETKEDGGDWESQTINDDDGDEIVVRLKDTLENKRDIQARVTLKASGSETPEIDSIKFIK